RRTWPGSGGSSSSGSRSVSSGASWRSGSGSAGRPPCPPATRPVRVPALQIAVLNGVNLNVLGRRNPEMYGGLGLSELESRIYGWALELGCTARCMQTNAEGEYVAWCHEALDWADGVIANPAAWTHYSYAIRDALELFTVPIVEVHLSNVDKREEWRRTSVISDLAAHRVVGKGPDGYMEAIEFMVKRQ